MFGYPVLVRTICRVPAAAVDPEGIRLPLMGVRLRWPEIADVRPAVRLNGRTSTPVLLVVPTDPDAAIAQTRWWLRRDARADLDRLGAPIVLDERSLDHTLADIRAAVAQHRTS